MEQLVYFGSGTLVSVTTNPYVLTGLTPQTVYDFYVQADCGSGVTSAMVGPFTQYFVWSRCTISRGF